MRSRYVYKQTVEITDRIENRDGMKKIPFGEHYLSLGWIISPMILFLLSVSLMIFVNWAPKFSLLLFIFGLSCVIWLLASIHIRFSNIMVTAIIGVGALLILLVACGLMLPKDAARNFIDFFGQ